MSDNSDGRAILASIPAHVAHESDIDAPLAVLPCLRAGRLAPPHEGLWVA